MRIAIFALVSFTLAVGCSAAQEGAASSSDLTGMLAPAPGLYTGTTIAHENTCGLGEWLDRAYVTSDADGAYATSYVLATSNLVSAHAMSLAGKTGTGESTQTIDMGDTKVFIDMKMVDTWQSPTTFVRQAEQSFRCEGERCEQAAQRLELSGDFPCSEAKTTAYAVAACDAYPFRQVYDPGITSVWVSGTFNDWAKTPAEGALVMKLDGEGVWTLDAKLPVPSSGKHLYKFIKNGSRIWTKDEANPMSVPDGMTGTNSELRCR